MKKNIKIFDISKVEFDNHGIKDFYWPVNTRKSVVVFNNLINNLTPLINKYQNQNKDVEAIKIFTKWFLVDLLRLLDASILYQDISSNNYKVITPINYRYINSFINQSKIECITFLNKLPSGLQIPLKLKLFIKRIIYNFNLFNFSPSFFIKKKVKCTENSKLIETHAKVRNLRIEPISFLQFLPEIDDKKLKKDRTDLLKLDKIIEIVENSYNEVNCKFYDSVAEYIKEWLNQAVNFIEISKEYYSSKGCLLSYEEEVWFGCGGDNIYNTLLIEILRKNNVKVVTHDHGSGNAHHDQKLVHWTEFIHSDLFVQHNPLVAKLRREALDSNLLFGNNKPKIQDIDSISNRKKIKHKIEKFNIKNDIKKIIYVSTAFHAEGQRMRPIIHDMTYYDWQIKLIHNIKKLNIDVLYKDHPESPTKIPESFYNRFSLNRNTKNFEEINIDADMFIVDFIFSSTTPKIFKSKKPILFIDLGFPEITNEALKLIKKRCYYIKAKYNNDSRLDIDWNLLELYLLKDSHCFDMTFPDLYFENCN